MDLMDTIREFARRLRLEHDSGAGSNEEVFTGFTARLRFRVSKRLEIPEYEQDVEFGPYKATLLAQDKGQPIRVRRDNQDENHATIRMRIRRRGDDEGRA